VDRIITVLFYIFPCNSLSFTGNTSSNLLTAKDSIKNGKHIHEETAKVEPLLSSSYIPSYYIRVIEEPNDQLMTHDHIDKELARRVDGAMGNSDSSSEVYEKTLAKHGDKTFYKFHKRIARCPEQILRYQFACLPLFFCLCTVRRRYSGFPFQP